jgi:hypothetical protein
MRLLLWVVKILVSLFTWEVVSQDVGVLVTTDLPGVDE